MAQLFCIILAGGSGKRLWPVSREAFPKQMLKINDDYTLFQRTFLNVSNVVNDKNIITTVNVKYASSIKEQLKELKEKFCRSTDYKIITEPIVKNTASAVSLGVRFIKDNLKTFKEESPVILVVPSDEVFKDMEIVADTVEQGVTLAENGYIVVFGSQMSKFDDNSSYFRVKKSSAISQITQSALKVADFFDMPQEKELAELNKNKLYVNSGIYMFSYDTFMAELKQHSKEIYSLITNNPVTDTIPSVPMSEYESMPDVSIEDVLISNTKKLTLLPVTTEWKDIGSWEAVYEVSPKNKQGNCFMGKVTDMDSHNSFVYSTDKLVATLGLKDMIVVSTEDASFICDRKQPNAIKKIYKKLNNKNSATKEIHKTVYRPWGYYTVLEDGEGFLTKCITVNPQAKLSLQKHFHRSEHWIILEGQAVVTKGNNTINLSSGESIDIGVEEIHSLQNLGQEQLKILEVQLGEVLDENDIERIEDIYGRV